jgi:hypothetical protein
MKQPQREKENASVKKGGNKINGGNFFLKVL